MRSACLALLFSFSLVSLAACAVDATGASPDAETAAQDLEAATATAAPDATPSAAKLVGLYVTHAKTHGEGDLTALELRAASTGATDTLYVREHCYGAACTLSLPETDRYDVYTSAAGKTYVRFWSVTLTRDANGNLDSKPTIADVYEIATTSSTLKLRKSYSTRWFSLYRTTAKTECTASGGTPSGSDCACPNGVGDHSSVQVFVPGAGGCIDHPSDSESNCDASNGLWTDDDATLTGEYCVCGVGRYEDATGTCSAI